MTQICSLLGLSRQGYYKGRKKKQRRKLEEEMIIQQVETIRRKMPMLGGRKLYKMLLPDLRKKEIKLGRDKFFRIMERNGLLVKRKKKYTKTTNSFHRFRIYENLIKDRIPEHRDEVWVSDITYISAEDSFCYLSLISDLYSRKIVGYDISDSLNMEGCMRSLKLALKDTKDLKGLIHHSDRGIQYCCYKYTDKLTENKIQISMSEKGNPYENAVAERINGILKEEFLLGARFKTKALAYKAVDEAIKTYNELRPHMSLDYMTPNQKHAA